ncbi:antibiotic biosynthesis monooxygenase (plasmid) [Streptomyces sp. NBC_01450]|uniref:antibiotic biosynthesis monooxygenase family protein n=1 Tax=Streptomyces sp. NBC_01450 TaxID=2903871 RepID=UPI002E351626|nr:antibiotic biosynthesis monooxygenase family protein [Streptomyces sp. NBC_01450]
MIIERATFRIRAGEDDAFQGSFREAVRVISDADGLRSVRLARGVEHPGTYLALLEWDSVDDHMRFRSSEYFETWAGLLRPHYAAAPDAEHYAVVVETHPSERHDA